MVRAMTAKKGAKGRRGSPQKTDKVPRKTWKLRLELADKLSQLAALLKMDDQDVLDIYERQITEDLLRELARRTAEIESTRPGPGG